MKMPMLAGALALAMTGSVALAGPDFVTPNRSQPLAASDGQREELPQDDVMFAWDSAALSPTARAQLTSVARWLEVHPDARIVLEGHADATGKRPYNADLAERRAQVTRQQLTAIGVDKDRIVVATYGENRAKVPADRFDRRVVVFASTTPLGDLVSAELDRAAIEVTWTRNSAVYHESRGITPLVVSTVATE
jgi:outer membrane protein OmpA-like peptidoglycan-associated protein